MDVPAARIVRPMISSEMPMVSPTYNRDDLEPIGATTQGQLRNNMTDSGRNKDKYPQCLRKQGNGFQIQRLMLL